MPASVHAAPQEAGIKQTLIITLHMACILGMFFSAFVWMVWFWLKVDWKKVIRKLW